MTRSIAMVARTAVFAVLATIVTGCPAATESETRAGPEIEFVESASTPVYEDAQPDGIVTARLVNRTDQSVTIVNVQPKSDAGLEAGLLGHSTCQRGCTGAGLWSDPESRKIAENGLDGLLPLTLGPNSSTISLVFRLRITDSAATARLRAGCWFRMRDVEMTLADGQVIVATTPAEGNDRYIAGLHASPARPDPPKGCTPYRSQFSPPTTVSN